MNWILVCAISLLLFNSCLAANIDRQQQNRSESGAQAEAFNEDLLLPVFDIAALEEILQMVKNPQTAEFVKNTIFPAKYPNYTFNLMGDPGQDVIPGAENLYIPDLNLFVDVLKHFGEHIHKIGVPDSQNLNEEDYAVLNGGISEHCTNSLTSIYYGYIRKYTFTNFTKPLPNMKTLFFNIKTNDIGSILPFDVIFPNVDALTLNYFDSQNNNQNNEIRFIESEFPVMEHLKQLDISIIVDNHLDAATIQKQIGNMMQKNPQIQSLYYNNIPIEFIHEINEYLPNLEHFSVQTISPEIQPVHFENVKHFNAKTWGQLFPADKITFSRLESLGMNYEPNYSNETVRNWLEFFEKHQNLGQITCNAFVQEGLVDFLGVLPNLEDIRISSYWAFDIDFVSQLIESQDNLTKFHFDANPRDEYDDLNMDAFREKFEHEWNIIYNFEERPFIELERKN